MAIAPTLIAGFTLVQKLVPSGALTEGLNWTITALGVGAVFLAVVEGDGGAEMRVALVPREVREEAGAASVVKRSRGPVGSGLVALTQSRKTR